MTARVPSAAEVAAGLRRWIRHHDPHVQAAVQLLLAHDVWLYRAEFRHACVRRNHSNGDHWIDWEAARTAFDAGTFNRAASTERAVLDLVIAIGADHYRFSRMDTANSRAIAKAVAHALGVSR